MHYFSEIKNFEYLTEDMEDPPELNDNTEDEDKPEEIPEKEDEIKEEPKEEIKEEIPEESINDEKPKEEVKEEISPEKESFPKQIDREEKDKNGVRRKKLYIAFIEWAKQFNPKNTFGSVFDKDVFHTTYPFVPYDMRYFYRLANPILCVLSGKLTFFQLSELRKLNAHNQKLSEMMIFAATDKDCRVFSNKDYRVYMATVDEEDNIHLGKPLGNTFDEYLQQMIKQGDILNGPIEDESKVLE